MDPRVTLVYFLTIYVLHVTAQYSWSNSGETGPGPSQWASRGFPTCSGNNQSPIDVTGIPKYDDALTPILFHGYNTLGNDDLELVNAGWTAKVAIKSSSLGTAYFTGGGISDKYIAAQLHFHWGTHNNGSSHSLWGHHYALELHVVHFKEEYNTTSEAIKHSDGLAVMAFFFEIAETDNHDLEPFFSSLDHISYRDDVHPFGTGFDKFVNNHTKEYFRYHGSMTHPPCNEAVTWTLFKHVNTVSSAQVAKLRQLHVTKESDSTQYKLAFNNRPTQPLGNRHVTASFHIGSAAGNVQGTCFGLAVGLMLLVLF